MRARISLPRGTARLYILCMHLALGSSLWGYNIGILSSILVHPGWQATMHHAPAPLKGLVTGIYYVGTFLSYVFLSHYLADRLGRRYASLVGTLVLSLGAVLMATTRGSRAAALAMMLSGRAVCGVGVGVVSTSVPLYQSEISPAKSRGKFVTMNHVGFISGLATGLWVGYGMTFLDGEKGGFSGWRTSIWLQILPAVVFAVGLPFCPETPRWLVEHGYKDEARRVLKYLRQGTCSDAAVDAELASISSNVTTVHRASRRKGGSLTKMLFTTPSLRGRLWRAFLLQFMAQMCGATAMKYYLPSLLRALGLGRRLALMAGAVEMTIKIGLTVVEMWVIDRWGRKVCLVGGSCVMGLAMLVNGALPLAYPASPNKVADTVCIAFIFLYAMGYSLGLGPAAWVYSSEIFPTSVRARGLNLAASGGSIGSIIVAQIWPVGLANLGSGVYFFFMVVNAACVPIICAFYPETRGVALEDMDSLFGTSKGLNAGMMMDGDFNGQYDADHGDDTSGREERPPSSDERDEQEEGRPLLGR